MDQSIRTYLDQIRQNLATGATTEHTHRPALAALLESILPSVQAINEPRRIACGAPDLAVLKNRLMVGHVEAKDIGAPLDGVERSAQLKRYRKALDNLILTDYLEFRWFVGGDLRRTACLARWTAAASRPDAAACNPSLSCWPTLWPTPRSPSARRASWPSVWRAWRI